MIENWDDIRIFLAAARGGSLSEAGRRLRMDPATVGRRITRLEDRVGVGLFVKSPQGYVLTEAGQRLVDPAEAAERAMLGAQDLAAGRDNSQHLQGQIRIGAPMVARISCSRRSVRKFAKTTPISTSRSCPCPAWSTCRAARPIWPFPCPCRCPVA